MAQQKPDKALELAARYRKGYAHGGRVGYEDGGAAGEVVRDLERGVLPRNYKRVRANRALAGQEMRPMEADRYADYLAMEPIIRGRRMEAFDESANAAALARAFLPNPDVLVPREGAERAGPDIRRRQQDQLMRGVPLSPQQDAEREAYIAGLPHRRELKANELDEGATAGRFANEALPFAMPGIGRGLRTGLGAGAEFVGSQLARMSPATRAAVPFAGAVPAFAAMGSSEAGAESKEQIKARQEKLAAAGFYKGAIDGDDGVATKEAQRAYDSSAMARDRQALERLKIEAEGNKTAAEAKKAEAALEETKRLAAAGTAAEERRRLGEERLKKAEEDVGPLNRIIRDYGPMAGYGLGALMGYGARRGVVSASDALSKARATRADTLIKGGESKDLPQRVANLNQFWSEGQPPRMLGQRTMPYEVTTTAPGFKPTDAAKVTPSSELYTPNIASKAGNLGTDLGVAAGFGAEYGLVEHVLKPEIAKELEAARAAVKEDPSEANIGRLQAALNSEALAKLGSNVGRTAGVVYLGSGVPHKRTPSRPNIADAEAERIRINDLLTKPSGPAGQAPPGPPPTLPPLPVQLPTMSLGSTNGVGKTPSSVPSAASRTSTPSASTTPASASSKVPGRPEWATDAPHGLTLPKGYHWDANLQQPRHESGVLGEMPKYRATRKKAEGKSEPKSQKLMEGKQGAKAAEEGVPQKETRYHPDLNDPTNRGMKRGGMVSKALELARKYAGGGRVMVGPVVGETGGRADKREGAVESGAFVWPADVVSGRGQGNTQAGQKIIEAFESAALKAWPHGGGYASGGDVGGAVPVRVADGERITPRSVVLAIGQGDLKRGHDLCDAQLRAWRNEDIHTLSRLPGPAR